MFEYSLVIPMAGLGSRFTEAGYKTPKPLLAIGQHRMFEVVIANLAIEGLREISIVAPRSFGLNSACMAIEAKLGVRVHLTELDSVTDGPATTVGIGLKSLVGDLPVVVANSDQFLDFSVSDWFVDIQDRSLDGSILVMEDDHPKWSYAKVNSEGHVEEVREKEVISTHATCGVYYFRDAGELLELISEQRLEGQMVNGEFYVAPIYNLMVRTSKVVGVFDLGPVSRAMYGLGVPRDYELFQGSKAKLKAEELADRLLG